MFDVKPDRHRHMLRIKLSGFWDGDVMRDYMCVLDSGMEELQRSGGCRSILIDMIDFAIQPKEIAEEDAANLRVVSRRGGTRVALVMQSALSKLQAARVASDTGHRTFSTEAEAVNWLLEGDDGQSAAH